MFLSILNLSYFMNFERRDAVLIAGLVLFMIGLIPFMSPFYAVIIVALMYFGIKLYVGKRQQSIARDVGEGICIDCGAVVSNKKCPNCDSEE